MKPFPATSKHVVFILCALLLLPAGAGLFAQDAQPAAPPPGQTLSPDQLDDLVAPVALYPDPLLSQVLVASTYPLEVVQAYQWLQRNPGITGATLTQAAQQQNWDASIQALIVFPDVIKRLNDDVTWTTNLGNAFLAQQPDVMDAVQRMRLKAQQAGKLTSTSQETVATSDQGGQTVVEIEPASPDVIYVPVYDPGWIWGPPVYYPYPRWYWPPRTGGLYIGFGGGVSMGVYFGGGWGGWGAWGWHPGWHDHTVVVNNTFIHRYNYNTTNIVNLHGTTAWTHDVTHRGGVPYSTPALNQQYRGAVRQNLAPRPAAEPARAAPQQPQMRQPQQQQMRQPQQQAQPQMRQPQQAQQPQRAPQPQNERVGNRQVSPSAPPARGGSAFGNYEPARAAQSVSDHGYSSLGPARSNPGGGHGGGGGGAPRQAPSRPTGRGGRL